MTNCNFSGIIISTAKYWLKKAIKNQAGCNPALKKSFPNNFVFCFASYQIIEYFQLKVNIRAVNLFKKEGKELVSLVKNIKSLCSNKKTSIPKLEKELGFGNGAIYNWDKNSPTLAKVIRVSNYFGVTIDFLVNQEIDKAENCIQAQQGPAA